MKKLLAGMLIFTVSTGLITGCSTNTRTQNTGIGAVAGGAVGGVASGLMGADPVVVGLSAVAGALIGGYIGHSMDSSDNMAASSAMNNATNMPSKWKNPKTGVVYRITPTSNMMTINGTPNCRTYMATAKINGKKHMSHGTACKQSDGSWLMMKN